MEIIDNPITSRDDTNIEKQAYKSCDEYSIGEEVDTTSKDTADEINSSYVEDHGLKKEIDMVNKEIIKLMEEEFDK